MADYQLDNTGQVIQQRLDQVPANEQAIANEVERATGAEAGISEDVAALETAVNADVQNLANNYYNKSEVDGLIIPHDEEPVIVGTLPASGEPNKIYRVPGESSYSDYAWVGSDWVLLATHNVDAIWPQIGYYVCETAAATSAKTVAASGYILATGGCLHIKMTNANTAENATLNINGTGAKALYYDGAQASSTNSWEAGEVLEVYYDGTQYQCASGGGGVFDTGEKVSETGIVDVQTDNSKDVFSSGGAAELSKTLAWILGNLQTAIQEEVSARETAIESERHDRQEADGNKMGEDEALVLAHALCELNSNGGGSSGGDYTPQGSITVATSDTMVIFGSSFGIGYTTAGKHWVDILNQFSDYSIQNLSADGQSNLTRLIALRNGNISPAPSARFALIVNSENMGQDVSVVYQSFINLAHAVKSYGMQPILGTSYRKPTIGIICSTITAIVTQRRRQRRLLR